MTAVLISRVQGAIFLLTLWLSSTSMVLSFAPHTKVLFARRESAKKAPLSVYEVSTKAVEYSSPSFETTKRRGSDLRKKSGIKVSSRVIGKKPTNIESATTLAQYKEIINRKKDNSIIVTKFYAEWCKSCKAMAPLFRRLARRHPNVSFIEVPVQSENSDLHQGLSIESVPFSHIYFPTMGLVEEMKMSKAHWPEFEKVFTSYIEGSCRIDDSG